MEQRRFTNSEIRTIGGAWWLPSVDQNKHVSIQKDIVLVCTSLYMLLPLMPGKLKALESDV